MRVYRPEVELETPVLAWWTENDTDLKFCIAPQTDCAIGFTLDWNEAKEVHAKLGQFLARTKN